MSAEINRRTFMGLAATAAMASVPLLGACRSGSAASGDDWEPPEAADYEEYIAKLHEAARGEGSVVWYTSAQTAAAEAFKASFEEKFPDVAVLLFRATVPQILQKFSQEFSAQVHTADVLGLSSPGQSPQFHDEGWVTPYRLYEYDAFPPEALGHPDLFEVIDKYTPFAPIVYNTQQLSRDEVPTSLLALSELDPGRFDGRITMSDPRNYPFLLHYVHWVQTAGREMPQNLRRLNPVIASGGSALVQTIASGEYWLCHTFNMQAFVSLKATTDAPVDFVVPEEGIWMQPGTHLATANAPHPNAARLFLEYIFSEEGQGEWAAPGFVPTRPGVPLPAGLEWVEEAKVAPIDFASVFADIETYVNDATSDLGL